MGSVKGDHDEEPQYLRPGQTHHKIYLRNAISLVLLDFVKA